MSTENYKEYEEKEEVVEMMKWEELSESEAEEVRELFERFMKAYEENPKRKMQEWLAEQLQKELPEESPEKIQEMAREIEEAVKAYEQNLENLNKSCRNGATKESWLAEYLQDSAKGMAVTRFGNYLYEIDKNLEMANAQMERVILRTDGNISQALNLDGFIAEQYHVNAFNAKAVLEQSPYRARVLGTDNGGYAKHSVDVVIDNIENDTKAIERYQFVFGKNGESTIAILKRGDYRNQRIVVPKEQLAEIQKEFPTKTVTDHIGGTEKVSVQSSACTKKEIKEIQRQTQGKGVQPEINWNSYQTKELAVNIGKQASKAGVYAVLLSAGLQVTSKAFSGEKIEADHVVKTALQTGSDVCIKAAAGGALKVAVERSAIRLLPKGTPAGVLTTIACTGVETVKILWKVAKGELTMTEAIEYMGRANVSMVAGLGGAAIGAKIGVVILSWLPIVGPLVGGFVGGIVGYTAGSKIGEKVFEGGKKVAKKCKEIMKKGVQTVENLGSTVKNIIGNVMLQ